MPALLGEFETQDDQWSSLGSEASGFVQHAGGAAGLAQIANQNIRVRKQGDADRLSEAAQKRVALPGKNPMGTHSKASNVPAGASMFGTREFDWEDSTLPSAGFLASGSANPYSRAAGDFAAARFTRAEVQASIDVLHSMLLDMEGAMENKMKGKVNGSREVAVRMAAAFDGWENNMHSVRNIIDAGYRTGITAEQVRDANRLLDFILSPTRPTTGAAFFAKIKANMPASSHGCWVETDDPCVPSPQASQPSPVKNTARVDKYRQII